MGKLTSLVAGAGQGYLAAGRYQDAKDRNKTQDALLKEVLLGKNKDKPEIDVLPKEEDEILQAANGGLITQHGVSQSMPTHHDKMSWQRQSFKK